MNRTLLQFGVLFPLTFGILACASTPKPWVSSLVCGKAECVDVFVSLDVSLSANDPWPKSGTDLGEASPTFRDSEIRAIRTFMDTLESDRIAVGLGAFSGAIPNSRWRNPKGKSAPAWTEEPLSNDFARLDRSLAKIRRESADEDGGGLSYLAAGVDLGTIELLGLRGAESAPRLDPWPAMVVFTDNLPTLPYGPDYIADNLRAVHRALARASRAGIECYLFALGPDAKQLEQLADDVAATGGRFVYVEDLEELDSIVVQVAEHLSRRRTTGPPPTDALAAIEGVWGFTTGSGRDGQTCSENPHIIAVTNDRTTLEVQYEFPIARGDESPSRTWRYRVLDRSGNFIQVENLKRRSPVGGRVVRVLRVLSDSYCQDGLCAERCP